MIIIVLIKQYWSSINYPMIIFLIRLHESESAALSSLLKTHKQVQYIFRMYYILSCLIFSLHRFQMLHILSCLTIFTSFPNTSHLIFSTWILLPINIIILLVISSSSSMGSSLSRSVKTVRGFFCQIWATLHWLSKRTSLPRLLLTEFYNLIL